MSNENTDPLEFDPPAVTVSAGAVAQAVAEAVKKEEPKWSRMDTEFTIINPDALVERKDLANRRFQVEYRGQFFDGGEWVSKASAITNGAYRSYSWVCSCLGQPYLVHVLRDGPPEPLPDGKKCLMKNILPKQIIDLLKQAPENETFRAMVLKITRKPIPKKVKTFEQVQEWIEANIDATVNRVGPSKSGQTFQCEVVLEGTETGRCRYYRDVRGMGTYELSMADIRRIVHDAENADAAIEVLNEELRDMCYDERPNTDVGEERTDDHESDEDDDLQAHPRHTGLLLKRYLWTHMRGDYTRLFGDQPPE